MSMTWQDLLAAQEAYDQRQKAEQAAYYASPQYAAQVQLMKQSAQRGQMIQDRDYGLQLQRLKQERDQMAISQGTAKANQWYQQQQIKLAKQAHDLAVGEALGYVNGSPTLNRERFQSDAAQGWANLGTQQRGPENAFQYAMLRGQAGTDPLAAAGFRALAGGPQANAGTALTGQPTAASLQGLSAHLLGTGAQQQQSAGAAQNGLTSQEQQMLATTNAFGVDPGKAAGQAWETLGDYGQKVAGSYLQGGGFDPNEVLSRYRQTRFANPSPWG